MQGVRESGVPPGSIADPSLGASFEDADEHGIWKEIHTDTCRQYSGGSISSNTVCFEQTSGNRHRPLMEQPAVPMSPSRAGDGGRIAVNTTGSNYYARGSPKVPHSPQTVNILSSQLRPLEKSPKRTQLHITNPGIPKDGGLAPMVNQLTWSPQQTARPVYDHDVEVQPSTLPPAAIVARSPYQVKPSSPVTKPTRSSTKLKKKLMQPPVADPAPRPSVSKEVVSNERSPSRSWKSSFPGVTMPEMAAVTTTTTLPNINNTARSLTRDMNGSFLRNAAGRATAAAATCVTANSSSVPSWRGCGDGDAQAMVVPDRDREICQGDLSGELERPEVPRRVGGGKKVASTQKSGSFNIFNFRNWGKKKSSHAGNSTMPKLTIPTESFLESGDLGSAKADSESIKVLDYTMKTLRYKLEQVDQKRATAEDEICALQSALEASEEKCRQLTHRCHELELQLSARSSGLWDMELEERNNNSSNNNSASYVVGRRDVVPTHVTARFQSQDLTPELFLKIFEDAIASVRKLASAICHHIRENGESATQVITALLEQHKVGRAIRRMPRNVIILYFESFLNQVLFESFENVSFEPNGASSIFCPDTLKEQCFQAFESLRIQEWSSIEKRLSQSSSAVVVNASFHRFFVVRMELILSQLGKLAELQEISLSLMAAFFYAAKGVWLVHHLAFAYDQPVSIFRVSPAAEFDARFMQQVTAFEEDPPVGAHAKVGIMLNPGFLVDRQIIKCQVYCCSQYSE